MVETSKIQLDPIDLNILRILQDDARISNVELAERVGLSATPCLRRVRRLEESGFIRRHVTLLDQTRLGLPVSVFIWISLERQHSEALEQFETTVGQWPEVMESYLMTGDSDYLLRVVAADLEAVERFIRDKLARAPGVANIRSSFALKQVAYRTALPI